MNVCKVKFADTSSAGKTVKSNHKNTLIFLLSTIELESFKSVKYSSYHEQSKVGTLFGLTRYIYTNEDECNSYQCM